MAFSFIEWTEFTWNPVHGCTPLSSGCLNCYAASMANRLGGRYGYPADDPFRVTLRPDRLEEPLGLTKPRLIFVCSMADLLHEDVPTSYIQEVVDVMRSTPHHTYQVLTKRSERLSELESVIDWPANVWLGVTVEEARYQFRIDHLRATSAKIKFLSLEPLLGPLPDLNLDQISWVVAGGEAGTRFRAVDPDWIRDVRDQCLATGGDTAFFFKRHGGRRPKEAGRILDGRTWDQMPVTV
ncbi:MAG: phage Gp37/Gp68 family protein [Magnetococcales bacterium]|nr:phage Gp37/Gp68 family protein [Magnetococcales bacterium]